MKTFLSYKDLFLAIFHKVIPSDPLHVKWLNTLSCLEYSGATKISASHHAVHVRKKILQHAQEEFRHALHLKRQIDKITSTPPLDYAPISLFGGRRSHHYLGHLEVAISRHLIERHIPKETLPKMTYILLTYAIELRAEELYSLYEETLREYGSKVTVKSILLEEKGHLEEMESQIMQLSQADSFSKVVQSIESRLCLQWLEEVGKELLIL